jgi:MFS family permease
LKRIFILKVKSPDVDCEAFSETYENKGYKQLSIIKRLSGADKFDLSDNLTNTTNRLNYTFKNNLTYETVVTEYSLYCDLINYVKLTYYANLIGFIVGALLLGILADKGGRKIIVLGCIWVTGIMSIFQVVGHDFISYVFFQLFLSIFAGGVHAVFLPTIIEMFPINLRTFYGVFFHLIVSIFEIVLPLIAKGTKEWTLLQMVTTVPLILTAPLQWIGFESIFWYLAHKEYDKAIKTLTVLAKRNGIEFETKFKQAKEFLHAKHSKATQVDIMPLLRLQDVESLGKKYPTVDMADLQKEKMNSSKLRRFLNSLKGKHYRSTNTIYHPFDFMYSPTFLIYVLILCGLWFSNGLSTSIEEIMSLPVVRDGYSQFDEYTKDTLLSLVTFVSASLAVSLSFLKISRRWMIFLAYLFMEFCLLGSLISKYNLSEHMHTTNIALNIIYFVCKFSTHFGFIFLMLITAELFPTSLRCTGMSICFIFKLLGELLVSKNMVS